MKDTDLRKLQLMELEILKKVDSICREYKINYFLIGGSLLGAVRHNGFIPWDDDIDIGMLREDYDKFIDVCLNHKALGSDYFLHCNESDTNYFVPFIKVKKNNTTFAEKNLDGIDTHKGIFLDIFPYDNVPTAHSFLQKMQAVIVRSIHDTIYVKYKVYKLKNTRKKLLVCFLSLFSSKKLKKMEKVVSNIYNKRNTKYIICFAGSSSYEIETFLKEKVLPPKLINFEDGMFYGMNDNDYYLSQAFGDYMTLPPIEKRKNHNPTHINFLEGECRINEN